MSEELADYSFEQKERLARRIQKLKKQKYLMDIESIITKYNPDLDITTNPSGKFMYFQDLNKKTYYALDKYIRKILKYSALSETSENATYSEIIKYSENDDPFSNNPKLRYSNKERNLIKRKIYDKQINEDNSQSENLTLSTEDNKQIKSESTSTPTQFVSQNNVFVKRKTSANSSTKTNKNNKKSDI